MDKNWLPDEQYDFIIENAPLVSMDFIITNSRGDYLLNYRADRPAKDSWFFFGGAIKKSQTLQLAFESIINREFKEILSVPYSYNYLTRVVTHRYRENRNKNVRSYRDGIHYVVLCYEFSYELSEDEIKTIIEKHRFYAQQNDKMPHVIKIGWFSEELILASNEVHEYVKKYIRNDKY